MTVKRTKEKTIRITIRKTLTTTNKYINIQTNRLTFGRKNGQTISVTVTAKSNSIMVVNNIEEIKNLVRE